MSQRFGADLLGGQGLSEGAPLRRTAAHPTPGPYAAPLSPAANSGALQPGLAAVTTGIDNPSTPPRQIPSPSDRPTVRAAPLCRSSAPAAPVRMATVAGSVAVAVT